MSRDRAALGCLLALGAVWLVYAPYAEFVLDDWYLYQKLQQADRQGWRAEWKLAGALVQNTVWGAFRTTWMGHLAVLALSQLLGARPALYFLLSVAAHAGAGYLLYLTLARLGSGTRLAFLAGTLWILLPTARHPVFWFPTCATYVLSAFWFLLYLYLVAGTVEQGGLGARSTAVQVLTLILALFSTDQIFGLLVSGALAMAILWRSRAALASTLLAWGTVAGAAFVYLRFVNRAAVGDSVTARLEFTWGRVAENLGRIWSDYQRLSGGGDSYYRLAGIGWGALAALEAAALVFWRLYLGVQGETRQRRAGPASFVLFGAGLWAAGYGATWFLRWRELRYDYLPSLGLAVAWAAVAAAVLERAPRPWMAAGGAALAGWGSAGLVAEIQQCWRPQAESARAIRDEVLRLRRSAITT